MTGKLLESEIFGKFIVSWSGTMEYVPYKKAMNYCRNHQPSGWDPTDPSGRAASDLFASVAMGLEGLLRTEFDWRELKFFSAIKSPLDFYHGIDGWFEFRGSVVTIDITTNPNKGAYKADIVLIYEDDDSDEISLKGIEMIPRLLIGAA